jgi:hypothetical protein
MAAMLVRTRARRGRLICGLRGLGGLLEQKTERGSERQRDRNQKCQQESKAAWLR